MVTFFIFCILVTSVQFADTLLETVSFPQRKELNCSDTFPQWIGIVDANVSNLPYFGQIINQGVAPFNDFECEGRIITIQTLENVDHYVLNIMSQQREIKESVNVTNTQKKDGNFYNYEPSQSDLKKTVFDSNSRVEIVYEGQAIQTPGRTIEIGNQRKDDASIPIIMQIGSIYGLGDSWSNFTDCQPLNNVFGEGSIHQQKACAVIRDGSIVNQNLCFEETHHLKKCNYTPEWQEPSAWSSCYTSESCGNGSHWREYQECVDTTTNEVQNVSKCGEKIVESEQCRVFCPEDYFWNGSLILVQQCTSYLQNDQGSTDGCGNGFVTYSQSCYVDHDNPKVVDDRKKCTSVPKMEIMSCYKICPGHESQGATQYSGWNSNDTGSTSEMFTEDQLASDSPLMIHGSFPLIHQCSGAPGLYFQPSEIIDPYVFKLVFNKFVYLNSIKFFIPTSLDTTFQLSFIDVNSNMTTVPSGDSNLIKSVADIRYSFSPIPLITAVSISIDENLQQCISILISGYMPGVWGAWGNWTNCDGDWINNGLWNRTRDCFSKSDFSNKIDRKYCVGSFVQFEPCKSEALYNWNTEKGVWGNCTLNNTDCGNGFASYDPVCMYNSTEIEDFELNKWRCGEKPVIVKSCYEVCKDTCQQTDKTSYHARPGYLIDPEYSTLVNYNHIKFNQTDEEFRYVIFFKREVDRFYKQPDVLINEVYIIFNGLNFPLKIMRVEYPRFQISLGSQKQLLSLLAVNGSAKIVGNVPSSPSVQMTIRFAKGCDMPQWNYTKGACNGTCENGLKIAGLQNVTVECRAGGMHNTDNLLSDEYCIGAVPEKTYYEDCEPDVCFNYTTWSEYSSCAGSCGVNGTQNRTRECLGDGEPHPVVNCTNLGEHIQNRSCYNVHEPCYHWTTWGNWSEVCDNATSYRHRSCMSDTNGTGYVEVHPDKCNESFGGHAVDNKMVYSNKSCYFWGNWTSQGCDVDCGHGTETFERYCEYHNNSFITDSTPCLKHGPKYNSTPCYLRPCYGYSNWSSWTVNCSKPCGVGKHYRNRTCYFVDRSLCILNLVDEIDCNTEDCPVDGYWLEWSPFTQCSASCGNGQMERSRTCVPPAHGGAECVNQTGSRLQYEYKDCVNPLPCPGLTTAVANESCTSFCSTQGLFCDDKFNVKDGTELLKQAGLICSNRSRPAHSAIYDPSFSNGDCVGYENIVSYNCDAEAPEEFQRICNCLTEDDMKFGSWQKWGQCTQSCQYGLRERHRMKNYDVSDTKSCELKICPVDGGWTMWTDFSACSVSCGAGNMSRTRTCANPPPFHGGLDCYGINTEYALCGYPLLCPIDGMWGNWTEYEHCSQPCGGGKRMRRRKCNNPIPRLGGALCEGNSTEWEPCGNNPCGVVRVDLNVEFVKETYYTWMDDISSPPSMELRRKVEQAVRDLYKNHVFDEVEDFETFTFHSFSNGTGKGIDQDDKD